MRTAVRGRANFYQRNGKLIGWYRPTGALRPNRVAWSSDEPVQAARIFVGFNVGDTPVWSMNGVMALTREIREEQGRLPDSSFVFQRGIYAHQGTDLIVEEDGAQIIVLNLSEIPKRAFEAEIENLATKLATEMEQESVIVEFQRAGVAYKTVGIEP